MSGCPAFGSSSETSIYWGVDPDPALALPGTFTWNAVPITGESLNASLSSTISETITPARSYAGSLLTSGEVGGDLNIELTASTFFDNMILAVLQSSTAFGAWADAAAVTNESTKNCLCFLKKVNVSSTLSDWFVFRGCQISKLSIDMKPGALMTGSISIMGIKPDAALVAQAKPAGWTLTDAATVPFMSGVDSLKSLEIQTALGVDTGITAQEFSIVIDNQLRQQQAVGLGHPFAAGVASGRFMASASGTAYYASPAVYSAFLDDAELKIVMELRDSAGAGWDFLFDAVKVTSGSLPEASGPDQDLTVKTEFRAFQSASHGTVEITRVEAP